MVIKNMHDKIGTTEIQPNREAILKKVIEMMTFLYTMEDRKKVDAYAKVSDAAQELEKKYPNAREYYLFHVLIGSNYHELFPNFDFPGDDSVVKILGDLCREYKEKE